VINKKLHNFLNSTSKCVLIEKFCKPKIFRENGDTIFYYRFHNNGVKKYVLTIIDNKFIEETYYNNEGQMHRDYDLPAWIKNDSIAYFQNGNLHRGFEEPAHIHSNGHKEWYVDGILIKTKRNKWVDFKFYTKQYFKNLKSIFNS
jgi:hypothetical protein